MQESWGRAGTRLWVVLRPVRSVRDLIFERRTRSGVLRAVVVRARIRRVRGPERNMVDES